MVRLPVQGPTEDNLIANYWYLDEKKKKKIEQDTEMSLDRLRFTITEI